MLPRTLSLCSTILLALIIVSASGCGGAEARKAKHMAKGEAFLADGNLDKARVEFQNVLQIAPKDAEARFELGVIAEKRGDVRRAAQFYQATLDVSPDHLGAHTKLARLYLYAGAPDKALELLKPALEKHPDDSELLAVRAAARVQQKDADGARADAERAVQLDPTNEDAVSVLAGIYTSHGESAKATTLIEQSIQKIPGTVDLRLVLAQLYVQEGRNADAEALLIKLIALKPGEKSHRVRLAQFYARANEIDAAERTLREAIKQLPAERDLKLALIDFLATRRTRDVAEKELLGMIAADPKDNQLKFALASFYEAGQQPAKAEAVYQGVIDRENLEPDGLAARDRLAMLRLQRNDVPGALALANQVLAKSPRDDDALNVRGNISLLKNDPRAAIADLRAVLRDQPNAIGVLRALARAHVANGEPAVAEETMRHAVEANPKDANLTLEFAQLLAQLGKPDQAKPLIAALVKEHPDNLSALDGLFRVSIATKDNAQALTAAQGIVALRPKAALGYVYEGMLAEADNKPDEALKLYSTASDLEPNAKEPLEAETRLLVRLKRNDEALKRLDAIAAREPANALAPNLRGDVLVRDGRAADAAEAYKAAIARAPKWWQPYQGLAYAELAAKNPDAAIDTLRKALPLVEIPDPLATDLGSLLERQGKPDEAIKEYEALLRREPQSEPAANNLAMLLVTYKKDQASLDRAKDLASRFAESPNTSYLDTYGWVLYKRGEAAASEPVLERVVARAPNEPLARYHLGMAQSQLGSSVAAKDNLTRAVSSGANFPGLDEAKAALEKLAKLPATAAAAPKT